MARPDELIVYVDDERANRIVFEQAFGARFNVKTVSSGAEALELLRTEHVAVLITDQRMPGMSGNELLTLVKQDYPDVVRVIITAHSDLDQILAAVNDGLVARYIIKPWDHGELEQILEWSVQAFELTRNCAVLQLRLMQTERLVTLGSIAAAVIHEIHQPLAHLSVNAERLGNLAVSAPALRELLSSSSRGIPEIDRHRLDDLASELPEIARDMATACTMMAEVSGSMKQFARTERSAEPREVDPAPIVRFALSVCRQEALLAHCRVRYEGPPALPRLRAGTAELTQILINLVANAIQAAQRKATPNGNVVVAATEQPDAVRFTVSDDGVGMSEDVLRRVGTPFFSTRPDGTGLGVAQCRRLVGRLGSTLHIESEPGVGTRVSFAIPRT